MMDAKLLKLAAPAIGLALMLPASAAPSHASKTIDDLKIAYMGETTAHAKYAAFAQEAQKDGYPAEAHIFRAAAAAEAIHARNHKQALAHLGVANPPSGFYHEKSGVSRLEPRLRVESDLKDAMSGESYERDSMYPNMIKDAQQEGQTEAARSERYAQYAEAQHAALYTAALKGLGHNRDIPFYSVCPNCGATWAGSGPAACPVCGRPRSAFLHIR